MPVVDMPLEALEKYQGSSPCPPDFDNYWDAALAEMRATDPAVRFEKGPVDFPGVDCFDLYFNGVGGGLVHAKYLRPAGRKNLPAVLAFHGYGGNSGDWLDKLAWVQAGFAVAAMDCRNQNGHSQDGDATECHAIRGHIVRGLQQSAGRLMFRRVFLDTAQLAGIVMSLPEIDERRVMAMGGSQGGGLTVACAALEPRITKMVPIIPFLSDYRRVWEMDLEQAAYLELKEFFRFYDPLHQNEAQWFERLGYIDIQNLAHRVRASSLWCICLGDTVCPPSTQFAAYNKTPGEKQVRVYPDFAHETPPGFMDEAAAFLLA